MYDLDGDHVWNGLWIKPPRNTTKCLLSVPRHTPHVLYYLESMSNRPPLFSSNMRPTFLKAAVWPSLHSLGWRQPGHIVSFKNTLLSTKHVHFNTTQLGKSPSVSSPTHHTMHVRGKFLPQLMGQPNVSSSQSPRDGTRIIWHRFLTGQSPILVQLPSRNRIHPPALCVD